MPVEIAQSFEFFINEWDYIHSKSQTGDLQVLFYKSDSANKLIEIAFKEGYLHCEIRRLIDGQPAKYSDSKNSISHEDLAILESNHNYNHLDYYAGAGIGLTDVVKNVANLFKRNKDILTSDVWVDTDRLQQLEDADFHKKFGSYPKRDVKPFIDLVKEKAIPILKQKGYALIKEDKDLAPYDAESRLAHIVFFKLYHRVTISQLDWRDDYNTYFISLNKKKLFEVNINDVGAEAALASILGKLSTV